MKKSKLLQSSKDMLSRSFNPGKCKTSLRMAMSRLKLLRNKKDVQVKHMKKEVAQLLESGQEQTARIRVEHVIREDKMIAAYDLLEIYCELIIARLPIIESQKTCPIDLKEAIASVIFASPRCGDVPELQDAKKQFAAKYGKDFTTAAVELRPQSGVGRMLVEKLSAVAPDVQTKTKILSAIATEHNVEWEHVLLEEKVPSEMNALEKEGKQYVEPPHFKASDSQPHPNINMMPSESSSNVSQQNWEPEKTNSAHTYGVSTISQPIARPSGDPRQQFSQGGSYNSSRGDHRWTMEFKDATAAAQAAAESAERASIAAKAAAELSSQNRNKSRRSDSYVLKDERAGTNDRMDKGHNRNHGNRDDYNQSASLESKVSTFDNSRMPDALKNERAETSAFPEFRHELGGAHDKKIDRTDKEHRHNHGNREEYSQSASFKSKASTIDDSVNRYQYSQQNITEDVHGVEIGHEAETKSVRSSRTHSSVSDEGNIFANMDDHKVENEYTSLDIDSKDTFQTSSYDPVAAVFDRFDSDTEDHGFDLGPKYDEQTPDFYFSSLGQNSLDHQSIKTDTGNSASHLFFTGEDSTPDFAENSESRDDHFAPVTFDDSDGPTSDIDEDTKTKNRMVDDSDGREESSRPRYDKIEQSVESQKGYSEGSTSSEETTYLRTNRENTYADSQRNESSNHIGEGLSFGKLTGGLRHKGRNNLPSLKNRSSVRKEAENINDVTTKSTTSIDRSERSTMSYKKKSTQVLDSESSEDEKPFPSLKNRSAMLSSTRKEPERTMSYKKKSTHVLDNESSEDEEPSLKNRSSVLSSVWNEHENTNRIPYKKESSAQVFESSEDEKPLSTLNTDDITTRSNLERRKKKSIRVLDSRSDSDSSEDEEPLRRKRETYPLKETKPKSMLGGTRNSIFEPDNSDFDDDHPKGTVPIKSRLQSAVSRRTRASPSTAGTNSHRPEALDSDTNNSEQPTSAKTSRRPFNSSFWESPESQDAPKEQKSTASNNSESHSAKQENHEQRTSSKTTHKPLKSSLWESPEPHEAPKESPTLMQKSTASNNSESHSAKQGNHEQRTSAKTTHKPLKSSLWESPEPHEAPKANPTLMQKPNTEPRSDARETKSRNSSTEDEVSTPQRKSEVSSSNDTKRASHVHPKLPDYETLVQSLRSNRS